MPTRPDLEHLCRICAVDTRRGNSPGEIVHIFRAAKLKEKLEKFLNLNVDEDDFMPKILCKNCYRKVESISALANIAQQTITAFNKFMSSSLAKPHSQTQKIQQQQQQQQQQLQQLQHRQQTQPPPLLALSNHKSNAVSNYNNSSHSSHSQRGRNVNPSRISAGNQQHNTMRTNIDQVFPPMVLPKVPETTITLAPPAPLPVRPPSPRGMSSKSATNAIRAGHPHNPRDPRCRKMQANMVSASPFEPEVTLSVPGETFPTPVQQLEKMRNFIENFAKSPYSSNKRIPPDIAGTSKSFGKDFAANSAYNSTNSSSSSINPYNNNLHKSKNGNTLGNMPPNFLDSLNLKRRDDFQMASKYAKRKNINQNQPSSNADSGQKSLLKPCFNRNLQQPPKDKPLISVKKSVYDTVVANAYEDSLPEQITIAAPKRKLEDQNVRPVKELKKPALTRPETAKSPPALSNSYHVRQATRVAKHFSESSILVESVIRDVDLLKLILKALKWPLNGTNLSEQINRLKHSKISDILSDRNLLQDTDLTQLLSPILGTVPLNASSSSPSSPAESSPPLTNADLSTVAMPFKLPPETSLHCLPPSPTEDKQISLITKEKIRDVHNRMRRRRNSLFISAHDSNLPAIRDNAIASKRGGAAVNAPSAGIGCAEVKDKPNGEPTKRKHRSSSAHDFDEDNILLFPDEIKKEPGLEEEKKEKLEAVMPPPAKKKRDEEPSTKEKEKHVESQVLTYSMERKAPSKKSILDIKRTNSELKFKITIRSAESLKGPAQTKKKQQKPTMTDSNKAESLTIGTPKQKPDSALKIEEKASEIETKTPPAAKQVPTTDLVEEETAASQPTQLEKETELLNKELELPKAAELINEDSNEPADKGTKKEIELVEDTQEKEETTATEEEAKETTNSAKTEQETNASVSTTESELQVATEEPTNEETEHSSNIESVVTEPPAVPEKTEKKSMLKRSSQRKVNTLRVSVTAEPSADAAEKSQPVQIEAQSQSKVEEIDESVEALERNIFKSIEEESRAFSNTTPSADSMYSDNLDSGPSTSRQAAARLEKANKSAIAQQLLAAIGLDSKGERIPLKESAKRIRSALQLSLKQAQQHNSRVDAEPEKDEALSTPNNSALTPTTNVESPASTNQSSPTTTDGVGGTPLEISTRTRTRKSLAAKQAESLALEQLNELQAEEAVLKAKEAELKAKTGKLKGERPARNSKTQSKYYKDPNPPKNATKRTSRTKT